MYTLLNALTWILLTILYFPIFTQLYRSRWHVVDYTHAYFILPVSLWLIFRKRAELKVLFKKPDSHKGILYYALFLLGIFTFTFGWRWDYLIISTLSLVFVLYGLVGFLYGKKVVSSITFPLLYLLMLVPPPLGIVDNITLPMRHLISNLTEVVLKFFHYPISREGLLLTIGTHEVFMGQPCSGFRSLVTMFALALVYIYLSKGKILKKLILLLSVVPLALLGNLIRIIILCLITYYFGEKVAQGFFHNFSGLVIFVIIILGLIGVETLLDRKGKRIMNFNLNLQ